MNRKQPPEKRQSKYGELFFYTQLVTSEVANQHDAFDFKETVDVKMYSYDTAHYCTNAGYVFLRNVESSASTEIISLPIPLSESLSCAAPKETGFWLPILTSFRNAKSQTLGSST